MQRRLPFIFMAIMASISLLAQPVENAIAPSLSLENAGIFGEIPEITLAIPDIAALKKEDEKESELIRLAAPIFTEINPEICGSWTDMPNGGKVWQVKIVTPGALGQILLFDMLRIPDGCQLFAYNPNLSFVQGAFTKISCQPSGKFTIGPISGPVSILEYYVPPGNTGKLEMDLNRVDYAYLPALWNQFQAENNTGFGQSNACHINVNCPAGNNFQNEKKGIARIVMVFSNGTGYCSGSLMANTSGTGEPNFLTAYHCRLIGMNPSFDQWKFDFNYESTNCQNPSVEPGMQSLLGCQVLAQKAETDFLLLKLNTVPQNYNVWFNGWNRSNSAIPVSSTFIHHPQGDIKKITADADPATIYAQTINWGGIYGVSPANTHFRVLPETGTFEPGSSGSPLFDSQKRVVGQLHGGSADAQNPCLNPETFFGRLSTSWDLGVSAATRLKDWLDPTNSGLMSQNGYALPPIPKWTISGKVTTHWGAAMPNVKVFLSGGAVDSVQTDANGNYAFYDLTAGLNYTVTPVKDTNDGNGVSSLDLLYIVNHILTVSTFDSPYKIICADVNNSQTVTNFDIIEARKLVLGIYQVLPQNTSWNFFPESLTFPDPTNPFQVTLVKNAIISNLQTNQLNINFKGCKTGDVNNSANPAN